MNGLWKTVVFLLTTLSLANLSLVPLLVQAENGGAAQQSPELPMPLKPETDEPITVTIVGDILLDKSVGKQIERYGVDYPFAKTGDLLRQADLTVGNLETAVSKRGKPESKEFTFRSRPETLAGLVNAGFDIVNLANNHSMDYGMDAFLDTMKHLREYNLAYVGGGKNEEEAYAPVIRTIKGKRVAVIGLSRVLPNQGWFAGKNKAGLASAYSREPMQSYVRKAVEASDITIAIMHWNLEYKDYPEEYAKQLARLLIDEGVDAVVGSHSHSLMGVEWYKEAPIFYSVGNFVFTTPRNPKGSESMIVTLTFAQNQTEGKIVPAKIVNGQPVPLTGEQGKKLIQKVQSLSFGAVIDEAGIVRK
ncbi:CapA family protein [Brevibacillus ruminantium]|uniref:CapA family protein n=1 Tax=Brevibacillus ruminantium TaxID=2950604 RepID=A0ABY4WJL7_9BACL|nr:CapA family protein [Brevibacillus ruminantium]USG66899.1 CapA family protein [Brevibacillus ruminantium]